MSCSGPEIANLKSRLDRETNGDIRLNRNGLPTIGNVEITGNDLACWMSVVLAKHSSPAIASGQSGGYVEMYDNTMLAGIMWAMLGVTVLYYTVTRNTQ